MRTEVIDYILHVQNALLLYLPEVEWVGCGVQILSSEPIPRDKDLQDKVTRFLDFSLFTEHYSLSEAEYRTVDKKLKGTV